MSIPRLLHQTWKTKEVPGHYRAYVQSSLKFLKGWEYKIWDDADNRKLVAERYPSLLKFYDSLPRPIMRADMIRYLIMDSFGGMYMDLDYELLGEIPDFYFQKNIILPISREADPGKGHKDLMLGNCIFASQAGHPFWMKVIETLVEKAPAGALKDNDIVNISGPGLVTETYLKYKNEFADIYVVPRNVFHPVSKNLSPDYTRILPVTGALGIHHCTGYWRTGLGKLLFWLKNWSRF